MNLLFESRKGQCDCTAPFHKRRKFFIHEPGFPAEGVVFVDTDDAVKVLVGKGQIVAVCMNRDYLIGKSEVFEAFVVFRCANPEIGCIDGYAKLFCKK